MGGVGWGGDIHTAWTQLKRTTGFQRIVTMMMVTCLKNKIVLDHHKIRCSHRSKTKSLFRYSAVRILDIYKAHFLQGRSTVGDQVVATSKVMFQTFIFSTFVWRQSPPFAIGWLYIGVVVFPADSRTTGPYHTSCCDLAMFETRQSRPSRTIRR